MRGFSGFKTDLSRLWREDKDLVIKISPDPDSYRDGDKIRLLIRANCFISENPLNQRLYAFYSFI